MNAVMYAMISVEAEKSHVSTEPSCFTSPSTRVRTRSDAKSTSSLDTRHGPTAQKVSKPFSARPLTVLLLQVAGRYIVHDRETEDALIERVLS